MLASDTDSVLIAAAGDVLIDRRSPEEGLCCIRPVLAAADFAIGNFEGVLSDREHATPGSGIATIVPTCQVAGLAGFDVLSLANNHALDAGYGGLHDSLKTIRGFGIQTVGAGLTAEEAWNSVVLRASGPSVAVIAVSSFMKVGWEAKGELGGIAALRASDYYSPRYRGVYSPGIPPRITSIVDEEDWRLLSGAVARGRAVADFVIVSIHWGDHTRPWVVTDFQHAIATRLAALGVDLVLGHHQHYLRGIGLIGTTPVCYGLGHLIFDNPRFPDEFTALGIEWAALSDDERAARFGGRYGIFPRAASPDFPFDALARWTMIATFVLSRSHPPAVGVVPCYIGTDGIPRPVCRRDNQWDEALRVLNDCASHTPAAVRVIDDGKEIAGAPLVELMPEN